MDITIREVLYWNDHPYSHVVTINKPTDYEHILLWLKENNIKYYPTTDSFYMNEEDIVNLLLRWQ